MGWQRQVRSGTRGLPVDFVLQASNFLLEQDASSDMVYPISWLELLAMFVVSGKARFPVQSGSSGQWNAFSSQSLPATRHTVAVQLRLLRKAIRIFLQQFELFRLQLHSLDSTGLGFTFPCDGVCIGIDVGLLLPAHKLLRKFSCCQACRTVALLCRPFELLQQ